MGQPSKRARPLATRVVVGTLAGGVVVLSGLAGGQSNSQSMAPPVATPTAAAFEIDAEQLRRARQMEELMSAKAPIGGGFTLIDQTGTSRSLSDFRGQLVLLYFGYTHCADVCPGDLRQIGDAVRALDATGEVVQPLFVTVDPERDTPEVLRRYVPYFHPRLIGLTGGVETIRNVVERYKAYFAKVPLRNSSGYVVEHSANIYLIGRDGAFLGSLPPGTRAGRLAEAIRQKLS